MSLYFAAVNRNKRSVTLDIKTSVGRKVLYELVQKSDILVENFIPGKLATLGFGYEKLRQLNRRLIYASISGYGASGPYSTRAGYDAIAAAEGGLMHITGEADGKPLRPGLGMVDMSTGMLMHGAILAALRARESTGEGQKLEGSLFETQLSLLINVGTNWLNMGIEGKRYGAAHPSICPYDTYKTRDGHLALAANKERQWRILCHKLGRDDLASDSRFASNPLRVQHREALDDIITQLLAERSNAEWIKILDGSGLAHGPVNTIQQAFEHPQAEARSMSVERKSTHTNSGSLQLIGPAIKMGATPAEFRRPPPLLGEHTGEVLEELGYSNESIEQMREVGII